jgi:hypothetical protein
MFMSDPVEPSSHQGRHAQRDADKCPEEQTKIDTCLIAYATDLDAEVADIFLDVFDDDFDPAQPVVDLRGGKFQSIQSVFHGGILRRQVFTRKPDEVLRASCRFFPGNLPAGSMFDHGDFPAEIEGLTTGERPGLQDLPFKADSTIALALNPP